MNRLLKFHWHRGWSLPLQIWVTKLTCFHFNREANLRKGFPLQGGPPHLQVEVYLYNLYKWPYWVPGNNPLLPQAPTGNPPNWKVVKRAESTPWPNGPTRNPNSKLATFVFKQKMGWKLWVWVKIWKFCLKIISWDYAWHPPFCSRKMSCFWILLPNACLGMEVVESPDANRRGIPI